MLGYLKYPCWTIKEFITHPYWATRNTVVVLAAFWRTIVIGTRVNRVLKKHLNDWSCKTRGRYLWRAAHRFWAPWILERARIRLHVQYKEKINWTEPSVIVGNHTSILDGLIVVSALPMASFIAKIEATHYPFVGNALVRGGQIAVDRRNRSQASTAIRTGMSSWPRRPVVVFPEGTRTLDGSLGIFKMGAFKIAKDYKRRIVPFAIKGAFDALPKGSFLRLHPQKVTIRICAPISQRTIAMNSVPMLASHVHMIIEDVLAE